MKNFIVTAVILASATLAGAEDCYRCVIAPPPWLNQLECQGRFGTGGSACLVTQGSCWTGGVCGKPGGGLCDNPEDCIFDKSPLARQTWPVSSSGRIALAKRPDLLGRLLRAMITANSGGINVGPIVQGLMLVDGKAVQFSGNIREKDGGRLTVRLVFEDYPPVQHIEAELSEHGARGEVSITGANGALSSSVW